MDPSEQILLRFRVQVFIQKFQLRKKFVKSDDIHVLAGVAEHLETAQLNRIGWQGACNDHAFDDI